MAYAATSHIRSTAPLPAPINTNIIMNRTMSPSTTPTDTPKTAKRKGKDPLFHLTNDAERLDHTDSKLL